MKEKPSFLYGDFSFVKNYCILYLPHIGNYFIFTARLSVLFQGFVTKVSYFRGHLSPEHQGISGNCCDLHLGGVYF
jgi:hypothetical protein